MERPTASRSRRGGLTTGGVSRLITLVTACALASSPVSVHAQESLDREYQIKAAFLYHFVKFVEWPSEALPEASPTIHICVLGTDPFGGALEALKGKTVKGRSLVISRFERVRDLGGCHIAFVSSSEKGRLGEIVETLKEASVLTVGDMDRFAELGGIISFVVESNKVRFEINVVRAERARLKISSQLLKLARVVRETP